MEFIEKTPDYPLISVEGYAQTELMEFVNLDGVIYIKFDGLPYDIRTHIHNRSDYNQDAMQALTSNIRCGTAYYYPEQELYNLLSDYY